MFSLFLYFREDKIKEGKKKPTRNFCLLKKRSFREGTGGPSPLVPEDGYFCFEDRN
jgi:hypothetical protein